MSTQDEREVRTARKHWSFPIDIWVHEEAGEHVAWADPFSEVAIEDTAEEALDAVRKCVEQHLLLVTEEMQTHENVQVLCPLRAEDKIGVRHSFRLEADVVVVIEPRSGVAAKWTPKEGEE